MPLQVHTYRAKPPPAAPDVLKCVLELLLSLSDSPDLRQMYAKVSLANPLTRSVVHANDGPQGPETRLQSDMRVFSCRNLECLLCRQGPCVPLSCTCADARDSQPAL